MKKIVIETLICGEKTAILEDNKLVELLIDDRKSIVSNVYRGIVKKKLDGLSACFVDIGLEKLAYLKLDENLIIKNGDEVLVQINKDEIGNKGCKLNLEISISGRFLVYIPSNYKITISKKITDEEERKRLKNLIKSITSEKGFLIRTEALNATNEDIQKDIEELKYKYEKILKEYKLGIGPKLLYKNLDKSTKFIKDNVNETYEEIITNSVDKFNEIKDILKSLELENKVKFICQNKEDVFNIHKVDIDINKALNKKIWLKSGGYLIIEKTEALTVIDVNSGKFTGNIDLEKTSFQTNIEASIEICRQLKLRDIGGMIIVDFINMNKEHNKLIVLKTLEQEFKKDKRQSEVFGFTKLGLIEIVRRRDKESIDKYYLEDLESTDSIQYFLYKLEKEIIRIKNHTNYKKITLEINKQTRDNLYKYEEVIKRLTKYYSIELNYKINNEKIVNQLYIFY